MQVHLNKCFDAHFASLYGLDGCL